MALRSNKYKRVKNNKSVALKQSFKFDTKYVMEDYENVLEDEMQQKNINSSSHFKIRKLDYSRNGSEARLSASDWHQSRSRTDRNIYKRAKRISVTQGEDIVDSDNDEFQASNTNISKKLETFKNIYDQLIIMYRISGQQSIAN